MVDGRGRPLVLVVTAGQANDSPMLPALLQGLRVPRRGPGRPRTRPEAVLADKAYSSRAHRQRLRAAGVAAAIPEPADQIAHRHRRGSAGGRPAAAPQVADLRHRDPGGRRRPARAVPAVRDKQGLLDALADQGLERYARRKGELKTTEDPVADLRAGWDDHLLFAEENPGLYQLMFSPRPWSKSTARATVTDLLVHTLTRCAAAGALAVEPLSAAAMILSANVGLALSNIAAPTAFTDVAIISQQLRDALFAAVLAAPPTPQHADAAGIVASALQLRAQLSLTGTATS